ncbi:hypothetical protein MST22_15875 [Virgibacillus halodenitrificans]|uniref:hypothetical protein n=1 Tax=Virgibacillus halodenitrificans TaxID=1482 RepID=UPI001FB28F1E|nr:hypothetical protein [Virgibacillus halodenitrificans]MCJ0932627.1 hypothetical protein [Virgibacillus halodenitrificans]
MSEQEGVDNMPIWQDHERRITTLETTFSAMSHEMREVKSVVEKKGDEQKELLNTLIDHHLKKSNMQASNIWKLIFNITGTGGLLTLIIYAVVQFFN